MCHERDHHRHHRGPCCGDSHHGGSGHRHSGHHRGHGDANPGRGHHPGCGPQPHQDHFLHGCDCSLEEKLIYLERMLAYKKADVAALEAILEVLKESLVEEE
jgi:hypothetical protein